MNPEQIKQGLYDKSYEHDACGIGAVVNITGRQDHSIIEYGKEILINLHHRGAAGSDEITGDGAGILFQIPHEFFLQESKKLGFSLPQPSQYAVGTVFGSKQSEVKRSRCDKILADSLEEYGLKIIGWRDVPAANSCLGKIALAAEPSIKQIFVDGCGLESEAFERLLYLARKRAEKRVRDTLGEDGEDFYVA